MEQAKKRVPKRRFKEFQNAEAWERCKLGEISSLITKGTTPIDKSGKGEINYIKVENIDPSSGEINVVNRITLEEHNNYLKRSQLKNGDILFSIAGTLGRVTSVDSSVLPANTNQALAIIRLKVKSLDYVKTFLKGKAVSNYIKKNPTIGAQPNLSLEQVGNLEIDIPIIDEQKKIANLFVNLDNLITLHQRKLDKIKSTKKAYLYEMFPAEGESKPKRRFKGFTDDWEERKLGDVATYFNGGSFENHVSDTGIYELVTLKSVNMSGRLVHSGRFVNVEVPTLKKGTLVMILSEQSPGLLGMTALIPINNRYILNQRVAEVRPLETINSAFLSMAINVNQQYFSKRGAGTKVQNISKPNVENFKFLCPSLDEQIELEAFFSNLDNLITLHQHKLDKLKNLKKSYLNEMFI